MAKGFKAGAGGGAPLNFKVVGGTSAPSNPKENTIWVSNPNLLDFNNWANKVGVQYGSKAVSGNSITLTADENDCHTSWAAGGPNVTPIPCVAGRTYILEWEHSGASGDVYLFPSGETSNLVITSAEARKLELTPADGVTFFTFRVGVAEANTTATYSNIRISEKMAEITGWHFGAEEPNVYDIKQFRDEYTMLAPHKLSEGDILNFKIPAGVVSYYEAIRIYDPITFHYYCVRQYDWSAPTAWNAGTKVSVIITNEIHEIGGWSGIGTARMIAYDGYNHEEGTVWIQTGTTSPVAMNVLKKNSIQVCPLNAKQYVGGAWALKDAETYQGGAWVDWWNGELFDNGDQFESITGGWVSANYQVYGSENSDAGTLAIGDTIKITADGGQCCKSARTKNKIDLTNYKTITVTGTCMYLLISTSTSGIPSALATENAKSLDISGFSGEYYVGVMARNYGSMSTETIKLS